MRACGIIARVSSIAPLRRPHLIWLPLQRRSQRFAPRREAREERVKLLEEENRWLKSQLFGRSSEKTPAEDPQPDQRWLFNEAEALVRAAVRRPRRITIAAHERKKRGRKLLSAALPRIEVLHDLPETKKVCAADGTALQRIGEETSEQLDYIPAEVRVLQHIRPKYACPCCRDGRTHRTGAAAALPQESGHPLTAGAYRDRQVRGRHTAVPPGAQFERMGDHAWGARRWPAG